MFQAVPLSIIRSFSLYTQLVSRILLASCMYSEKLLMMERGTA